ncbi:MAG: S9 family peptidase [bacterium]|nr:MAG: S9 family peptidase [bacterium]
MIRRVMMSCCLLVLVASVCGAEEVLTVDRFVRMTRCTDPQISPNGKWVAFTVSLPDLEANRSDTDIWLVPLRGGEPVRLTRSGGADYHPRWSPDGGRIAFISTRGGSPQIWIIRTDGGEAVRLTDISTGAHDPTWSPAGDRIAFYSFVYPDCPGDSCNAARTEERESNQVKAKVIDQLLYRHWDRWKNGMRNHLFVVDLETEEVRDLTPMEENDYPPFPWGGSGDYAFSPQGEEICCVSKVVEEEAISTNTDLFLIDTRSGTRRKLTGNEAADESPSYSPDGRYIAYRAQERPGFESDRWRLMLYDRHTGEHREVTTGFDRWVSEFSWSPDSRKIYFTAGDDGHKGLFSLDPGKGGITKILASANNSSPQVSPDGERLVFMRRSFDFPHSIWTISTNGKGLRRLTAFNQEVLSTLTLHSAEDVRYEGAEGATIQAFLIKPPGFDPSHRWPAIMLIHGGPQIAFIDSWYTNWNAQTFASAGYVIFIPNFHGSDGFGQKFVDAISQDWGGRCYEDIMKGFEYLTSLPYVDAGRIGAAGASYGGYMINWIAGNTDRFACLVSMAGAFNLMSKYGVTEELWFTEWEFAGTPYENPEGYEKWSPHRLAHRFETPCMVVHGEHDFRVPIGEGLQMFTALQRRGVPSKLLYFPDEGHWILKPQNIVFYYEQFIDWMDRYLKQ